MATIATESSDIDEAGRRLVEGEIGRKLGLEPNDLRIGLDVAKNLLDRGAPDRAMRIYVAMVLCEPTVAEYQIGLANCAIALGEYYLAMQAASAVIAMEPANPRGYYLSGRACLAIGELAEAREDLQDAVSFGRRANDRLIVAEAEKLIRTLDAHTS